MPLHLRPATVDDHALYLRLLPELGVDDPPPDRVTWRDALAPLTVVAELDGTPVALCLWVMQEEGGLVRQLIVAPEARRHGAGRALLEHVAQVLRAAGRTRWELNVKPDNAPALRLYAAMGFTRAYSSVALRLTWAQVDALPPSPPMQVRIVEPVDDAAIEQHLGLSRGRIASRRAAQCVPLALVDDAGAWRGFSAFDPNYPGSFPFRLSDPSLARAMLEAMRLHARPGAPHVGVVVENDDALAALLRDHGAEVRTHIEHLSGSIPLGRT